MTTIEEGTLIDTVAAPAPATHAGARRTRSTPWEERLPAVQVAHPQTMWGASEFFAVLADYDLLGRVYRDVLRVGYEAPTRSGQRSPLEWHDGTARMRALAAERNGQATTKPFAAAFAELAADRSVRHLATKTGLGRSQIQRLLAGAITPASADIERVADAFGKPPTYFVEYRVALICATLADSLTSSPERSIDILVRMGVAPDGIADPDD